jgi:dihydroneopterin triphosphate diphosphatase
MIGRINVQVLVFTKTPIFRILILQRVPERNSYWQPISGGIERGEKPIDTVKRELFEETGIKELKNIINLNYSFTFETMWHGNLTKMKEICFAVEINKKRKITLSNEHQEYKWCTEAEARNFLNWEYNLIVLNRLVEYLKLND